MLSFAHPDGPVAGALPPYGIVNVGIDQVPVEIGFHAAFDAQILRRHGLKLGEKWLDLAEVAPALFPERGKGNGTLDDIDPDRYESIPERRSIPRG